MDVYYSRTGDSVVDWLVWLWYNIVESFRIGVSTAHRITISLVVALLCVFRYKELCIFRVLPILVGVWIAWHCLEHRTFEFSYVVWRVAEAMLAMLFAWGIYHVIKVLYEEIRSELFREVWK